MLTRTVSRPCRHIRTKARMPGGQFDRSRVLVMPNALRCFCPAAIIWSSSSAVDTVITVKVFLIGFWMKRLPLA
jgi:hypothetical protein